MTHAIDTLPSCYNSQMYESIQCGTSIDGHVRLDTTWHDNEGENISKYNIQMNEMTGIWWLYKHLEQVIDNNIDFIGIAHYRRYLDIPNDYQFNKDEILCGITNLGSPILVQYAACHYMSFIGLFLDSIKSINVNLHMHMIVWLCKSTMMHRANLFVMHKDMFIQYGRFIAMCIHVLMQLNGIVHINKQLKPYQMRWMSFILERMTSFWLYYMEHTKTIKLVDIPIVDIDIPNRENGTR